MGYANRQKHDRSHSLLYTGIPIKSGGANLVNDITAVKIKTILRSASGVRL